MSLTKVTRQGSSHLYEGPLDFLRGAGQAAGQKAANGLRSAGGAVANAAGAVKQQVSDVVDAGSAASLSAEIDKAVGAFAQTYTKFVAAQAQQPQQEQPPAAPAPGDAGAQPAGQEAAPTAGTPPGPAVQAKQSELAQSRSQRAPAPDADPAATPEAPAQQQQAELQPHEKKLAQQQASDNPFRKKLKYAQKQGKYGHELQFSSFLYGTQAEQIDEGVWDFVKGAGGAVANKVGSAIKSYSDKPSIFKDIYHAGVAASKEGDAASLKNAAGKQRDQLVMLIQKAGPQGPDLLLAALKKSVQDPAMSKKMFGLIMSKVNGGQTP